MKSLSLTAVMILVILVWPVLKITILYHVVLVHLDSSETGKIAKVMCSHVGKQCTVSGITALNLLVGVCRTLT